MTASEGQLRSTLKEFFDAIAAVDPRRIAATFAMDGEIEDPVGAEVVRGRENIQRSFETGLATLVASAEIETVAAFPSGKGIAAHWRMRAWGTSGLTATAEGVDVLTIADDGSILRVEGYWDAGAFVRAITGKS